MPPYPLLCAANGAILDFKCNIGRGIVASIKLMLIKILVTIYTDWVILRHYGARNGSI